MVFGDVVTRLAAGGSSAIFIDDSGLPAKPHAPEPLDAERKTWAAVFVRGDRLPNLFDYLRDALDDLHSRFGLSEFHACDIYNVKASLRSESLSDRLDLLRA